MYISLMLIPTSQNVKTITDMREDALKLLDEVDKKGLAYIFHRSRPRAVIMNIDDFVSLQEAIELLEDLRDVKKLSKEKRGKGVPLKDIASKYV